MVATTSRKQEAAGACDECVSCAAVLRCHACKLELCAACSQAVHQAGAMQRHLTDGHFRFFFVARSESQPSTTSAPGSPVENPAQPAENKEPQAGVGAREKRSEEPETLGLSTQREEDAEAYDLWNGWSVRSFSDRSSSIDSSSQWRNLRSLSIDSKTTASSSSRDDDDALQLSSISQSLQTLALVPALVDDASMSKHNSQLFTGRPRSYSDYTTLRSQGVGELWGEQQTTPLTLDSSTSSSSGAGSPEMGPSPPLDELWGAMQTTFASRHVVVRSAVGWFEAEDVRRISDTLESFGAIAASREEAAGCGLLFFTFFELKSAIGAVKLWLADAPPRTMSRSDTIHFCLPYELPDEANSATLLVGLSGPPVAATDMRQFCARYGEVASVLHHDVQSSKYIVEYNDARVLPGALNGLPCCFHPSGPLTATRTAPPTLDVAKLKLFRDCLEGLPAMMPARFVKPRPQSFSSSTTSLLTSPTSSVSSSLNASFLESTPAKLSSSAVDTHLSASCSAFPSGSDVASPVLGGLSAAGTLHPPREEQVWVRPAARARSNSSSAHLGGSLSSHTSGFSDAPAFTNPYALPNTNFGAPPTPVNGHASYQTVQHTPSHRYASNQQQQQQQFDLRGRMRTPTKFGSIRSGCNDSYFRGSSGGSGNGHANTSATGAMSLGHGHSGGSSTRTTVGRNDQGTGEFSLSIERVASGEDKRTTLMIRNIPNKYTQQMLLAEINQRHRGNYDFFYLPIDFKNRCNMGYAFINFLEAAYIEPFCHEFDNHKWTNFNSEKVCAISYARLQGKQAMIARFQNSSLLEKHESYRPLVFCSSGPNRGKPELFPAPKQSLHKKHSMHAHHPAMGSVDEYGNSTVLRMYPHSSQQHQQQQMHHHPQQHLLPMHPQQFMGMPQHQTGAPAMPPFPGVNGLQFTPHGIPPPYSHQQVALYQQYDPQLAEASRFLYGGSGHDYTR